MYDPLEKSTRGIGKMNHLDTSTQQKQPEIIEQSPQAEAIQPMPENLQDLHIELAMTFSRQLELMKLIEEMENKPVSKPEKPALNGNVVQFPKILH